MRPADRSAANTTEVPKDIRQVIVKNLGAALAHAWRQQRQENECVNDPNCQISEAVAR